MARGDIWQGRGKVETTPAVVIRPIEPILVQFELALALVNHSAPSGPAVRPPTKLSMPGSVKVVMTPVVVIRPILLTTPWFRYQKAPSEPSTRGGSPVRLAA